MTYKVPKIIVTEVWSIENIECSWEEFVSMVEQKIESLPEGTVTVEAEDDYDTGRHLSINHSRKETQEEVLARLAIEKDLELRDQERELQEYHRLKKKFDNTEE